MASTEELMPPTETGAPAAAEQPAKSDKRTTTAKEPKPKKPAAPRKRSSPSHPPYLEMIRDAIATLKDSTGSSQYAISKFIEDNQKNLPPNFKKLLLVQLRKLVASGKIVKVKGSFKLPTAGPTQVAKRGVIPSAKTKSVSQAKTKPKVATVAKAKPVAIAKPIPKTPTAAARVQPGLKRKAAVKAKAEKKAPAKVAKVSSRSTPRKKTAAVAATKKPTVRKVPARIVKPKSVKSPVKKVASKKRKM